jgi:hypothetical protein
VRFEPQASIGGILFLALDGVNTLQGDGSNAAVQES